MPDSDKPFVSRGGDKLAAALDAFGLSPAGWVCADFGANVGGFTDCLLRRGAAKVYAVDTGYGELAWALRRDPRVIVMERTNVLYAPGPEPVDLVVVDVAFTPQRLVLPAARNWLRPGGRIVSLLKPHYELAKLGPAFGGPDPLLPRGAIAPRAAGRSRPLMDEQAQEVCRRVCEELAEMGLAPSAVATSPLRGKGGNAEFLVWLSPK